MTARTRPNPARLKAERKARERTFTAPRGHLLLPCEPLRLTLTACKLFRLSASVVSQHAGLAPVVGRPGLGVPQVGELSGAVAVSSSFTRTMSYGRTLARSDRLYSWQFTPIGFVDGDRIDFHAVRDGVVLLWPMVLEEAIEVPLDLFAGALLDRPLDVGAPARLAEPITPVAWQP